MIRFEAESTSIINELKKAAAYLDCESIIVHHLKKHLANGVAIPDIDSYLKKLLPLLESLSLTAGGINYRYAAGYLRTLIATPYWHSWINTVK